MEFIYEDDTAEKCLMLMFLYENVLKHWSQYHLATITKLCLFPDHVSALFFSMYFVSWKKHVFWKNVLTLD